MARTALPKTPVPPDVGLTAGATIVFTAADVANLNSFPLTGSEVVIARNSDTAPHNVTISSAPDASGRKQDLALDPIPAAGFKVYARTPASGWRQSDGNFYLAADNALVLFAVLQLP